jgi:O-antigen/teichoic acid export membrane protein
MPRPTEVEERGAMARNAASNYLFRGLTALSVLLLTPYLFRTLGTDGFGTWSVMFTLATVFSLLEWGFSNGVTKYVAEFRAKARQEDLDQTVGGDDGLSGARPGSSG